MVDALADMARTWLPLVLTTAATLFLGGRFVMGNHASLECCRLRLWVGWVMNQLSLCQRMYVRSRRPFRIILMRHAESEGNVDRAVYEVTPDHSVKITERGKRQAAVAGRVLKNLVGDESVNFLVSPYTRTRMTYNIVREAMGERKFAMKEDPRLRELDFGNFQNLVKMQETMETRNNYGRFWFRFMNGESCTDVYDRATAFWESVFRSMDHSTGTRFQNYVIVTHGLMMRLILMRYFQWKVEFFERVWNPDNCETWVMERDELGSYRLVTEVLDRPPVESPARGPQGQAGDGAAAAGGGAANAQTAALQEGSGEEDGDGGGVRERRPSSGRGAAAGLPPPAPLAVATLLRGGGGGGGSAAGEGGATAEVGGSMDGARGPSSDGQGGGGGGGGGGDEDDDLCVRVCSSSRHKLTETATGHEVPAGTSSTSPRVGRRYIPMGRSGESALNLLDGGCAPEEEGYGRDDEL